jgi:hypothetical protein
MMTCDGKASHSERNYTVGTGNIIDSSTITSSPIIAVSGQAENKQPSWFTELQAELARIHVVLEGIHAPTVSTDDRDDAIDAVRALETMAASAQNSGQVDPKSFRLRIKALIGVLAPVAEIIGGVAALQTILQHL